MNQAQSNQWTDGRKAVVALLALLLLAVAGFFTAWQDQPPAPAATAARPPLPAPGVVRDAGQLRETVADNQHAPAATRRVLWPRGQVLDLCGDPVARVAVGDLACPEDRALATSDADGEFALPETLPADRLVVLDPRWVTVQSGRCGTQAPCTIRVAPRIEVTGTVLDLAGRPVVGALLSIAMPADAGPVHAVGAGRSWLSLSGADGAFAFAAAPALLGARLRTQHPGKQSEDRELPARTTHGLVVRLEDAPPPTPVLGTVFGPDGSPVADAAVRVGAAATVTDAKGTFALAVPASEPGDHELLAYAQGLSPTSVGGWRLPDGRAGPPLTVLLEPPRWICGRVVDASGRPCAEWFVTLGDPTPLDADRPTAACVEDQTGTTRVLTDSTGAFRFDGVFARPYTLEAWCHDGSAAVRSARVLPGSGDVVLTALPGESPTLHGRVVAADGRPVAGAVVGEQRPGCASAPGANAMRFDARVVTDADGRFALALRGGLHLIVDGPDVVPVRIPLAAPLAAEPLLVRVARRRAVHVDCGADFLADLSLTAVGADGVPLRSCDRYGSCAALHFDASSDDARSLPQEARTVIVSHRGVPLGRLALPACVADVELYFSASLSGLLQRQ